MLLLLWCVLAATCFTRVSLNPLITTEKTSTTWPTNDSRLQIYSAQRSDSNVSDIQNTTKSLEIWKARYMNLVDHIITSILVSQGHVRMQNQTLIIAMMPNETDPNYGPREQKKINQVYHHGSFPYQEGPDEIIQHSKRMSTEERWDLPFILRQKFKNREGDTSSNISQEKVLMANETKLETTKIPEFEQTEMSLHNER